MELRKKILITTSIAIILALFSIKFVSAVSVDLSLSIIDPRGSYAVLSAVPEKRIADVNGRILNRATTISIKVFPAGADRSVPENSIINESVSTTDIGGYSVLLFEGVRSGFYDIAIKGYSHLTRVARNIDLSNSFLNIDFTDSGSNPLLSGDINSEIGDDKVNALDISVLLNNWGNSNIKADLNQDEEVNSLDISNLLANFNLVGD